MKLSQFSPSPDLIQNFPWPKPNTHFPSLKSLKPRQEREEMIFLDPCHYKRRNTEPFPSASCASFLKEEKIDQNHHHDHPSKKISGWIKKSKSLKRFQELPDISVAFIQVQLFIKLILAGIGGCLRFVCCWLLLKLYKPLLGSLLLLSPCLAVSAAQFHSSIWTFIWVIVPTGLSAVRYISLNL